MIKKLLSNRSIFIFFNLVALLFTLSIVSQERSNYTLLWKIEGKGLTEPSYVFGTMHVEDSRAFRFSDAVLPALEKCKSFALEIQPDSLMHMMVNKKNPISAQDQLKAVLSDEEYQRLEERFFEINGFNLEESNIDDPEGILIKLIPIEEKTDDKSVFVDLFLLEHAKTMQKDIVGLEDLYSQMNYFDNLSYEKKREYILGHLDMTIGEQKNMLEEMTKIYHDGDISKIEKTMESYDVFNQEMTDRNIVMCKSIMRMAHQQPLFSAIGAAHLPGKNGVIALLQKEGYQVTPVEANFTGVAETYQIDESKMKWQTFEDKELGYSVETPQALTYSEEFPQFTLHLYRGMSSEISYMFMALDLRDRPGIEKHASFVETFMINMAGNYGGTLVDQESSPHLDGTMYSAKVETEDERLMKLQCFFKDNICYYLAAEMAPSQSENPAIKRFFNSLIVTNAKDKKTLPWINYKNDPGAFSVNVPFEPIDISRDVPNPLDPESEPYHMNLYSVNDEKNGSFYLIRYNDMPNGYYLKDRDASFDHLVSDLDGKAELLHDPKIIELNGHEGREIEVLMQGKYHAIMRIYIRGNRIHLILEQKIHDTDKVSVDDAFFKSFKFEDYAATKTKTYKPDDNSFEVAFFEDTKVTLDSIGYDYSSIKNSTNHFSKNLSTGALYQVSHGQLQDYFKIKNLAEFYDKHAETYREWNDSILSQKPIKIDNKDGMQYIIKSPNSAATERHEMLLDNDMLYVMTAYVSNEELNQTSTDSIFNSLKIKPSNEKTFDWCASKTDVLLKDLHSRDSLTLARAFGAFEYYEFENSDLPKLYKALNETYKDTLYNNPIKEYIIEAFTELHDEQTIETLKNTYLSPETTDELKSVIISTIPRIEDDRSIEVYKELLASSPPITEDAYRWTILSPFRDSLAFATENYKILSSLVEHQPYRNSVLSISTEILEEQPEKKMLILDDTDHLLKYAKQDLEAYVESQTDTLGNRYTYNSLIYSYLTFFNKSALNTPLSDEFTNRIIKMEDNQWYAVQAITARIKNNQDVDKVKVQSLMDSLYYRYDIMKTYHEINQFKNVPKKYKQTESYAELSLFQYITEDDYYPSSMDMIGKVKKNGEEYYAYKISYEDEATPYIATVGPIKPLLESEELNLYNVYSDWSYLNEGQWESQAIELIYDEERIEN